MSKARSRETVVAIPIDKFGDKSVGIRLRIYRKKLGLTQNELAARAKLSQSVVSRIERNPIDSTVGQLRSMCAALQITLPELLEDVGVTINASDQAFAKTRVREASKFKEESMSWAHDLVGAFEVGLVARDND